MYFCTACSLYVKDASAAEHDQSTAHMLSVAKTPTLRRGGSAYHCSYCTLSDSSHANTHVDQSGCLSQTAGTSC